MAKLMYALWGPADLHDPELHAALADAGATRVVVEVDDEHVADAQLRLSTYAEPVHAFVSVWTDGEAHEVTEVLRRSADQVAGWVVDERVPLAPPVAAGNERTDALVNVAMLRIPAGMTRQTWLRRWLEHHTEVAIETQATFGYVQNVVLEPLLEGQATVDALVEEFFPMSALTDLHAFYGSDGDDEELGRRMSAMLDSVVTFGAHQDIDVVPTSRYETTPGS